MSGSNQGGSTTGGTSGSANGGDGTGGSTSGRGGSSGSASGGSDSGGESGVGGGDSGSAGEGGGPPIGCMPNASACPDELPAGMSACEESMAQAGLFCSNDSCTMACVCTNMPANPTMPFAWMCFPIGG